MRRGGRGRSGQRRHPVRCYEITSRMDYLLRAVSSNIPFQHNTVGEQPFRLKNPDVQR